MVRWKAIGKQHSGKIKMKLVQIILLICEVVAICSAYQQCNIICGDPEDPVPSTTPPAPRILGNLRRGKAGPKGEKGEAAEPCECRTLMEEVREDIATIKTQLAKGDLYSGNFESEPLLFQSYNIPAYNFGIKNGNQAFIVPTAPRHFKLISPGLCGIPNSVSFKSESNPASFLRHSGFLLWLVPYADNTLYKQDSSFIPRHDLFYKGYTVFESVNFPGYYIRHANYRLQISSDDGSELLHKDSSFRHL